MLRDGHGESGLAIGRFVRESGARVGPELEVLGLVGSKGAFGRSDTLLKFTWKLRTGGFQWLFLYKKDKTGDFFIALGVVFWA